MSEPLVQTCFARTVPHVLSTLGLGPVSVSDALPSMLQDPKHQGGSMPLRQLVRLFYMIAEQTGQPDFGLLFGTTVSPRALGPFGMRLTLGKNVDDTLSFLSNFIGHFQQATTFEVTTCQQSRLCKLHYQADDLGNTNPLTDAQLALFLSCIAQFSESKQQIKRVYLRRSPNAKTDRFASTFGPEIAFGQNFDGFIVDVGASQELCHVHDPEICRILEETIVMRSQNWPDYGSAVDCVRRKLAEKIALGPPSVDRIAQDSGMSVRTLQRRLKSEGVSFSDLVDQVRMRIAKDRLQNKRQSITNLAFDLGYSDVATFSRAFRRLQGKSPRTYMKEA